MSTRRAFLVYPKGSLDHCGITAADSAGKARYASCLSAWDVGYDRLTFADFRVLRVPTLDAWAAEDTSGGTWVPDAIPGGREAVRELLGVG